MSKRALVSSPSRLGTGLIQLNLRNRARRKSVPRSWRRYGISGRSGQIRTLPEIVLPRAADPDLLLHEVRAGEWVPVTLAWEGGRWERNKPACAGSRFPNGCGRGPRYSEQGRDGRR